MRKTLYILRHAKAAGGTDDKARPLADRGFHEAEAMGKYLTAHKIRPDKILCSSSVRTRQTWEHVRKHYKENPAIDYTDAMYLPSAGQMLQTLSALPETLHSVMLIGHNPGLHELAAKLVKSGNERLRKELNVSFPPCSLASIVLTDVAWKDIALGGTLADLKFMEVGS